MTPLFPKGGMDGFGHLMYYKCYCLLWYVAIDYDHGENKIKSFEVDLHAYF